MLSSSIPPLFLSHPHTHQQQQQPLNTLSVAIFLFLHMHKGTKDNGTMIKGEC